jgi:NAD(P)-dependent dehydrogenase (short-subunit alcohol dehydrogenase family)
MEMSNMAKTTAEILQVLNLTPGLLSGKTAVITGAGRGIGREIARAFGWLGANVVLADISDSGMKVENEISEVGGSGKWIRTDVSSEDSVKNLVDFCEKNFGGVDYLINNAIYISTASVEEMEVKVWDQVISVNLRGTFLTCKYALPGMLQRGTGTIINMVSTDAMPYLSAYMASKGGISSFTQSLAAEVSGKGINVVALAPGFVRTPGMQSISEGLAPHLGMSSEEFLNLSLHPAYEGAMPAEDAGAATAYLAVRMATDYHGEIVTGYTVLESAGYLKVGQNTAETEVPVEPNEIGGDVNIADLLAQLEVILKEIDEEFNKLPIFVRPLARQGFTGKAGANIAEWQRAIVQAAGQGRIGPLIAGKNSAEMLHKLEKYICEVPQETARFTNDDKVLDEIRQITQKRLAVLQGLMGIIAH